MKWSTIPTRMGTHSKLHERKDQRDNPGHCIGRNWLQIEEWKWKSQEGGVLACSTNWIKKLEDDNKEHRNEHTAPTNMPGGL